MQYDVAISGAGPAGLSFALRLAGSGLSVVLIEPQTQEQLACPAPDGREIALTHPSRKLLEECGIWQHIREDEIAPLRDAQVLNGPSLFAMKIEAGSVGQAQLGFLVANAAIRRAAHAAACQSDNLQILTGCRLQGVQSGSLSQHLQLSDGRQIEARLLVAADSRLSDTRRLLGISAQMRDFGRSMLVCRMRHERPHQQVAWEWFDYGQTLALLPLNGGRSSVVLTLPQAQIQRLQSLSAEAFSDDITRRFQDRLGPMQLLGERHAYPLLGVYARRFVAHRAALIGDSAVGMHPVTAHGFNFALQSARRLAKGVLQAHGEGRDIASTSLLERYEAAHRLATRPLYESTNLIAGLYTDDRLPARWLRSAGLRLGQGLAPLRKALAQHLTR